MNAIIIHENVKACFNELKRKLYSIVFIFFSSKRLEIKCREHLSNIFTYYLILNNNIPIFIIEYLRKEDKNIQDIFRVEYIRIP